MCKGAGLLSKDEGISDEPGLSGKYRRFDAQVNHFGTSTSIITVSSDDEAVPTANDAEIGLTTAGIHRTPVAMLSYCQRDPDLRCAH